MRHQILETKQQVEAWNHHNRALQMKLGDTVTVSESVCPTCFGGSPHDAVYCYEMFPPVPRARVRVEVDCPTCGNCMLEDKMLDEQPVIMCCNPHCPDNGHCFKPPTVRLERLFE